MLLLIMSLLDFMFGLGVGINLWPIDKASVYLDSIISLDMLCISGCITPVFFRERMFSWYSSNKLCIVRFVWEGVLCLGSLLNLCLCPCPSWGLCLFLPC